MLYHHNNLSRDWILKKTESTTSMKLSELQLYLGVTDDEAKALASRRMTHMVQGAQQYIWKRKPQQPLSPQGAGYFWMLCLAMDFFRRVDKKQGAMLSMQQHMPHRMHSVAQKHLTTPPHPWVSEAPILSAISQIAHGKQKYTNKQFPISSKQEKVPEE